MTMYDDYRRAEAIIVSAIISVALIVVLFVAILTLPERRDTTAEFEIWDAKCPFGHYYTEINGGGFFLAFTYDSTLGEGYVFKYFENDILRTLIVESTNPDCRVHLTNDSDRMWMVVHFEGSTLETQDEDASTGGHDWIWMDVYVPDPKVMV